MPVKVLYVDDDPVLREIVEILLGRRSDFEVRFMESGEEALSLVDEGGWVPDVIVIDACMPGLDGLSTYREMKKRHTLARARYAFATGLNDPDGLDRLQQYAGAHVIAKPFDVSTFADQIASLAGGPGP